MNNHFLQSEAWAQFQQALGKQTIRRSGAGWQYQGFVTRGRGGITYLYCPYGPTLGQQGKLPEVLADWREQAPAGDFVRCEPMGLVDPQSLEAAGLRQVREFQPQHTLVVDLTQDEAALRQGMTSGHRNSINGAERRGLSFRRGVAAQDLSKFLEFIHETAARTGFRPFPDSYFKTMMQVLEPLGAATVYVAEHEGQVVGAAIGYDYEGTRMYAHAAASSEARKLGVTAPLVWFMMNDAKSAGMTAFDLWGIAPEGAPSNHPWAGFTTFKRSFGGAERVYAGTWELPLRTGRYGLYQMAKRILRLQG